ncbi:hypothetical protein ACIPY2_01880 [Paenarthrobacter sp. NPDC089675]|uniref:hypothetical protein n=1 Tax=Paenarthrobacter sp. NPDC089675 TaxID=3364376 RepID=UPI0038064DFC
MTRTAGTTRDADVSERGSAAVEFVVLSLMLLLPLVYFVVTIGQIQAGMFAAVAAADYAAKVYVAGHDPVEARARAEQSAVLALKDHGFPPESASMDVSCDRADCLSAGATVTVTVRLTVGLPMVPFGDSLQLDAAVLHSTSSQKVGRFR